MQLLDKFFLFFTRFYILLRKETNMTLIEILASLEFEPKVKRDYLLKQWGVDEILWKHINECFDKKDRLVDADGKVFRFG